MPKLCINMGREWITGVLVYPFPKLWGQQTGLETAEPKQPEPEAVTAQQRISFFLNTEVWVYIVELGKQYTMIRLMEVQTLGEIYSYGYLRDGVELRKE